MRGHSASFPFRISESKQTLRGRRSETSFKLSTAHTRRTLIPNPLSPVRILSSYLLHLRLPDLPSRQRILYAVADVSDQGHFGLLCVARQGTL